MGERKTWCPDHRRYDRGECGWPACGCADDGPIWRGTVGLRWRADAFGRIERWLYAGALYVGSVDGLDHPQHQDRPWRGWIMIDDDGKEVGWYRTKREAQDALEDAATKALLK